MYWMNTTREICENFVRVGLTEWYDEGIEDHMHLENISIHDLLQYFAIAQAMKEGEIEKWHSCAVKG